MDPLRRTKFHILERCFVQSAQLYFAARVQSRRKHFSRMLGVRCGVGHAVERTGKTEASQRTFAVCDSLHPPTIRWHTEQMHLAAHVPPEINEFAVGPEVGGLR